jgi:hypothetical protein
MQREREARAAGGHGHDDGWTASSPRFSPLVMKEEELGLAPEGSVRKMRTSGKVWQETRRG